MALTWLGIEPYELLMPPAEALALRQLRETARAIAAADSGFAQAAEKGRGYESPPKAPTKPARAVMHYGTGLPRK